ncbi:HEC/Ndc80p family-domain-containing protein [Blakeslea trispora]|nr:HEC/Ndc80p family-domain-containing protein [Blakeslea trispora]
MGCCCSSHIVEVYDGKAQKMAQSKPVHQSVPLPPNYNAQGKPFKRSQLVWSADEPMTQSELDQKRRSYWEVASGYSERKEIWQALQAAFSEQDIMLSRSILKAANIILPTGNPCNGCFDELGNAYEVPLYCIVPPTNLLLDQDPTKEGSYQSTETASIPDCSLYPFSITIRLSTNIDILLTISSTNETVGSLKERIFKTEKAKIDKEKLDLCLVYLGRVFNDTMPIALPLAKRPQVGLTTAMNSLNVRQSRLGPQPSINQDGQSQVSKVAGSSSTANEDYLEILGRFNAGDTFETKKHTVDTQSIKDTENQRQSLREITEYLKRSGYDGPYIKHINALSNREFQPIFKYLATKASPHYVYKKRFEEDVMILIRQLGYPAAETINRKELLSIGAMHSKPTFIALLHWLVLICKIMDTPITSDNFKGETGKDMDEHDLTQLLHFYAVAGYHEYMAGNDNTTELDLELERIFVQANQPNMEIIEDHVKLIGELEQEVATLETDDGELELLRERSAVLAKDIGKYRSYIEEKSKKINKYRSMVERAGEEKKRLEKQLQNIQYQIESSRAKMAQKNVSEEELSAAYEQVRALEKEHLQLGSLAEESRQSYQEKATKLDRYKEQVEKLVEEYNQKARALDNSILQGENIFIQYNPSGKTLKEKTDVDIEEDLQPKLERFEKEAADETTRLLSQTAILRQELDSFKLENSHVKEDIRQQEERVENLKRLYKENHAIYFQEIGKFNKMKDEIVQGWNAKRSIMRKELLDLKDEVRAAEQRLEEVTESSKKRKQEVEKRLIPVLERVKTFFEQACQKANEHNQAVNKLLEGMFETFSVLNID